MAVFCFELSNSGGMNPKTLQPFTVTATTLPKFSCGAGFKLHLPRQRCKLQRKPPREASLSPRDILARSFCLSRSIDSIFVELPCTGATNTPRTELRRLGQQDAQVCCEQYQPRLKRLIHIPPTEAEARSYQRLSQQGHHASTCSTAPP